MTKHHNEVMRKFKPKIVHSQKHKFFRKENVEFKENL